MIDAKELSDRLEGRICGCEMYKGDYIHVPMEEAKAINELLKAQEPVEPWISWDGDECFFRCMACDTVIFLFFTSREETIARDYVKFCRKCGRPVKW